VTGQARRLWLRKVGPRPCVHVFQIVIFRDRMFLKCDYCPAETEPFRIHAPLKGGR
jgi:hypothetical protein